MSGRRQVTVWMSVAEFAAVDAAAVAAGVETGAVCREAIVRSGVSVARDAAAGRVRLRRRSGVGPSRAVVDVVRGGVVVGEADAEVTAAGYPVPESARPVVPASGVERADLFRALSQRGRS